MTEPFIDNIPYRLALAGGWIDQPFLSRLNPDRVGAMVVVSVEPTVAFMERSGMATGTRKVAVKLWSGRIPRDRSRESLVRELYAEENRDLAEPSGSQDMIGLIYPGVSRLDYDASHEGGIFPRHIEHCVDPIVAQWIERVIHLIPISPRPDGYSPLGEKHLDPKRIAELGETGRTCFDAIITRDLRRLGDSMNRCMACWEALLPHTVRHPTIPIDLMGTLREYQSRYAGAMYSGCGGGYVYVASDEPVPNAMKVRVRL
ncbi:MAG: hypothetical protein H7Z14_16200 [Anaerolineae bacterium]|nr:hypothetical protein [Phycisphaerae bacterium]